MCVGVYVIDFVKSSFFLEGSNSVSNELELNINQIKKSVTFKHYNTCKLKHDKQHQKPTNKHSFSPVILPWTSEYMLLLFTLSLSCG